MSGVRRAANVLVLVLAVVGPALAAPPVRMTFPIPGEVVAAAELPGGGVALAAATPDGEVALWRVEMESTGPAVRPLQAGLGSLLGTTAEDAPAPSEAVTLTPVAGSGGGELVLSSPGSIWRIGGGPPRRVEVERGFAPVPVAGEDERLARVAPEGPLALARAGELLLLDPASGAELARVRLPAEARQQRWGLELRSPPVRQLPRPVAGTVVVVGPQKVGDRRLRTLLVDAAGTVSEAWSLLPASGRLLASHLLDLDGRVALVAMTAGDGLLAKQRLHLFALEADRTRRGAGPLFSTELDVRHWFEAGVFARDLDGDGRAELVLVEPRGLGGRELTVTRFLPTGGGRFAVPPRRVKVSDDAGRWSYGGDVDGDGVPDLLQLVSGSLALHRGRGEARTAAIAAAPEWSVALEGGAETRTVSVAIGPGEEGEASSSDGGTREERADRRRDGEEADAAAGGPDYGPSRFAVADLDRDGRGEVLHWRRRRDGDGGTELTIYWQRGR